MWDVGGTARTVAWGVGGAGTAGRCMHPLAFDIFPDKVPPHFILFASLPARQIRFEDGLFALACGLI